MNEKQRKIGRPKGSVTATDTAVIINSQCQKCSSSVRGPYTETAVQFQNGTLPNGVRFTRITRRRCRCLECDTPRTDVVYDFVGAVTPKRESGKTPLSQNSAPKNRGNQIQAALWWEGSKEQGISMKINASNLWCSAVITAAKGSALAKFSGLALATIQTLSTWSSPIVTDLAGMIVAAGPKPLLLNDDHEKVIGHVENIAIKNDGTVAVDGVISGTGKHAVEVRGSAANGFPWRLMLAIQPLRAEFVSEGESTSVSGENALESALASPTAAVKTIADYFGAGAAALGIEVGARALKSMAETAGDLRKELEAGTASAGDVVERMMAAVPIFGQVWQAGRAIREAIFGENEELKKQAIYVKEAEAAQKLHVQRVEEGKRVTMEWAEETRKLRSELEVLNAPPGQKAVVQTKVDAFEELRRLKQKYLIDSKQIDAHGMPGDYPKTQGDLKDAQRVLAARRLERDRVADELAKAQADYRAAEKTGNLPAAKPAYDLTRELPSILKQKESDYQSQFDVVSRLTGEMRDLNNLEKEARKGWESALPAAYAVGAKKIEDEIVEVKKKEIETGDAAEKTRAEDARKVEEMLKERRRDELETIVARERAETESKQKLFEMQGQLLDADLERIRAYYAERKDQAKSAAEYELLLQSQKLDEIKAGEEEAIRNANDPRNNELNKRIRRQLQGLPLEVMGGQGISGTFSGREAMLGGESTKYLKEMTQVMKDLSANLQRSMQRDGMSYGV